MYLMHVQVESIKKQTKETKNDKFKMIMASAVAFYIPVTTFTCPRKDRRFTIQWVFGQTPWIEKRTMLIQKGVQRQLHLQKNRRVKTKWTSSRASSFGFSLMVTIKWSTDWDKKVSKYKQTHFIVQHRHMYLSLSLSVTESFLVPRDLLALWYKHRSGI